MKNILFEIFNKIKENQSMVVLFVCMVLISFLSFAFGYIVAREQGRPNLEFEDIINYDDNNEEMSSGNNS